MVVLAQIALPLVAFDSITVASVLLAIVGTLYLAYDLLGRQHGPLKWLTLSITCGLVNALVLGFVGTLIYLLISHSFNFKVTLQTLAIGGLMGVFTVILVDLPKSQAKPGIVSRKGSAIGLTLGLLFFFTALFAGNDVHTGLNVRAALTMGVTCAALAILWPYLTWVPSPSRPQAFSRKGFVIGVLLGLLFWSAFFFLTSKNMVTSVVASIPLAFVCGGLIGLWRFIHWETSTPQNHIFSRKGFVIGFVIGFIPWLMFELIQQDFTGVSITGPRDVLLLLVTLLIIVIVVGILSLASAVAGSISRYILWRADKLPLRFLGAVGLVLILLGFCLQAVPPVIELINILGT